MAHVMHRFRQRQPHQAGRRHRAIEPGERHHVEDGRDATPGLADQPRRRFVELDLCGGVGAVAELVLEAHQPHAVARSVGQQTRHEETRQPVRRLRQHQESVAGRRRQEPLVPGQAPHAVAALDGLGGVGVDVAAALLLGHAHADREAGLLGHRAVGGIVFARTDARQPAVGNARRMGERGDSGVGHRHRAKVAGLDLRRHVEPRGTCCGAHIGFVAAGVPHRAVQAGGNAAPHERVPSRMELDIVDPEALGVVGFQDRREIVGDAAEFEGIRRAPLRAILREAVDDRNRHALDQRAQAGVAGKQVQARKRRRLVEDVVRVGSRSQCALQSPRPATIRLSLT